MVSGRFDHWGACLRWSQETVGVISTLNIFNFIQSIFTLRNDVMSCINVRKAQNNNDFLQFYFKKREN